ncbi:MAG: sigma-70 family RNA polymerase sigma factor [Verrucomicrobia bacterium]|nr:sigma-70 family RNA polymerase sigma factor [Verrucomicrobiota bacterium]
MDATDSALMSRLAAGDDLALNILMTRWSGRVVGFIYRMTGRHETAADLAQETFVKLYQARTRYRPQDSFSTYLFAIAVNLARNHARWQARHPSVSLDATGPDGTWILPEPADPHQTPAELALSREKSAEVNRAILALPLELREALTLFIHEGMSYAGIAELCRCSPKAVETRIYRARQILKEQLKDLR